MGKRKRNRRARRAANTAGPDHLPAPKTRLKRVFRGLTELAATADASLLQTGISDPLARFDATVLARGVNAVKSVRLLLEQAHWEFAAAAVRQLYETLVNMEYLATQPNRSKATLRYAKFGLLQMVRHELETARYDERTGRSVDPQRVAALESMLDNSFPEFRHQRPGKAPSWDRTWAGKTTRDLAELSGNRLRLDQYRLLFVTWSEQAHASPATLLEDIFPPTGADPIKEILASDDVRIAETAAMTSVMFIELWRALPHAPPLDPETADRWVADLADQARELADRK